MNFCKRPLNVHIGQRNTGNHSIKTLVRKWQVFTDPLHIGSPWKSDLGKGKTTMVEVQSCNLI